MAFGKVIEQFDFKHFDLDHIAAWSYEYLYIPPAVSVIYLALVFVGKKWMEDQKPFDFRLALTLWNCALAIFSTIGFLVLMPPVIHLISTEGYVHAVCNSKMTTTPWLAFWALLFVLSKVVEFGDTFFIVLRKSPLSFLHWYHHITVLLYSWYGLATKNTAGHWFSSLNFGVHSIMYTYYMFKAMRFRISSTIAKMITVLQLVQFCIGLVLVFAGMRVWFEERECGMNGTHVKAGLIMYGSYFILFLNFFCHRYIKQKPNLKTD